jgi:hypothetical protein
LDEFTAIGKKAGLHSFEIPKAVYLTTEAFTVENGMLTVCATLCLSSACCFVVGSEDITVLANI